MTNDHERYGLRLDRGIWVDPRATHRPDHYDPGTFGALLKMQREHFWYVGRHRFIRRAIEQLVTPNQRLSAIDLGGGCGGWMSFVRREMPEFFQLIAHADSSFDALQRAHEVLEGRVACYQVDLLNLPWRTEWNVAFLLDVIEHVDDDVCVMKQVSAALVPGGYAVVTTPALRQFWTYNDDFAQHRRRYDKAMMQSLATATGLRLVRCDYFMFLLSPALLLSRWLGRPRRELTDEERRAFVDKTHAVPWRPLNRALLAAFSLEALACGRLSLPWGTSILAVFQKPSEAADDLTTPSPAAAA